MEHVEILRFLGAEHGGHHRVDEGLHGAVAESENDAPDRQVIQAPCLGGGECRTLDPLDRSVCHERKRPVDRVAGEGEEHGRLVTDFIDEQAPHNDRDGEGPDTRAFQGTDAHLVDSEVRAEADVAEIHSRKERESCGDEGDETAPKKGHVGLVRVRMAHVEFRVLVWIKRLLRCLASSSFKKLGLKARTPTAGKTFF